MKREKIIYFGLLVIVFLVSTLFFSYAFFTGKSEHHGKLNIVAGDLNYKIESDDLVNNQITVEANTTKEITLTLTSLNDINSKYELYYVLDSANNGVSIGYSSSTKDTVSGTIDADGSKEITVIINNESDVDTTVTFGVTGGFVNNSLVLTQGNSLNKIIETQKSFAQTILENNTLITTEPTLTTSSNNTTDASGLYKSTATNDGSATYYFRGNVENNYVEFAGFTWRIVRINEDGTVRLIMSNGINSDATYQFNSSYNNYTYMYYSNSNAKSQLESWYQTNITDKGYSDMISIGDYYCEQAKVADSSAYTINGTDVMPAVYDKYTPSFTCIDDINGKGVINASVGLITYDEMVFAGGYPGTTGVANSLYYLYNNSFTWSMSPTGFANGYAGIWEIIPAGSILRNVPHVSLTLRPVINLKSDTIVTGTGTSTDSYKVFQKEKLSEAILANNLLIDAEPTLTDSSNNTTDASGLYKSTATNDGSPTYYFRGNVENNYVEFAGFTWRIVRINEDGTVRLILKDEIDDIDYAFNSNSNDKLYMYYSNSSETGIKKIIDQWYTNNIANNINYSSMVVVGKYCEQAKTAYISSMESNSGASMTVYSSYKPDFKCTADGNGKGILEENIGLISYDEVVYAGGYFGKGNSSYYLYNNGINWWTMSPAGIGGSTLQWYVNDTGYLYSKYSNTSRLRPVINLKADTVVTGFGTSTEPYKVVIQETDSLAIGQSVTAIDGSKWHVLEASSSDSRYVTLLSDYNLNPGMIESSDMYNYECTANDYSSCSMAFDSDNTNIYDETDSNNIGYFIKNTYNPLVTAVLPNTVNVTLPTAEQIANVENKTFSNVDLSLTTSWLLTTNYWTKTTDISQESYVWYIAGTASGIYGYHANTDSHYGARPVITTLKTNLLAN